MTAMDHLAHTGDEPPSGLGFNPSATSSNTPIITVGLELDRHGQMSVPYPTHCPWCGDLLGPNRVLVGWSPGHELSWYRCEQCERTWCPTGPDDDRGRPASEYGPDAGMDRMT